MMRSSAGHRRRRKANALPLAIWGVTGSIGMGKTTVSAQLARLGAAVFSSDEAVHRLMGPKGKALPAIHKAFPGVVSATGVDRRKLGKKVFGKPAALAKLEAILHPLVGEAQRAFIHRAQRERKKLVILDIPLLFETGAEARLDRVITVSAPALIQKQRVMRREGMSEEKLAAILRRQWADHAKRKKADAVVLSGVSQWHSRRQLMQLLKKWSVT